MLIAKKSAVVRTPTKQGFITKIKEEINNR